MKKTYRLASIGMVAAFGVFGLTACNSDDYKSGDPAATTTTKDTVQSTVSSADKTTQADAAKTTAKKRKASINWPADNTDKMVKDKEGVYNRAEVAPQFPGGQDALATYVNNHLDYTQQAIDDNTTGVVRVSFVVDENGKVTKAQLVEGGKLGNGLDDQALRVVNSMPAWKPGKVNGKNVKTRLELPINFQLEA